MEKGTQDSLPSYKDSLAISSSGARATRQELVSRLSTARNARVETGVESVVDEVLGQVDKHALSTSTVVLIPSDVEIGHADLDSSITAGLETKDCFSIIQLNGEHNNAAFWKQEIVLSELGERLRQSFGVNDEELIKARPEANPTGQSVGRRLGLSWARFNRKGDDAAQASNFTTRALVHCRWLCERKRLLYALIQGCYTIHVSFKWWWSPSQLLHNNAICANSSPLG